ncbi:helicase SNF2, partial [Listeria monocytogenes]|nr:helicase SNF2 [Listeria monocytogenes]
MKMTLLDNQKQALIKLKKYKVGALFMKPGSGKTRVACELINDVNPDYVLWI